MKVLCPECQTSISLSDGEAALNCESCGLKVDISQIGTSPGTMPVPMVRDFSGERLGDFELVELIGVGGMGVVYKAVSQTSGETVAVKILNNEHQWNRAAFVARFKREAEALKRLDHPNVVRLIDSGNEKGSYYLVTEFVDGENLATLLRTETLTIERVVEIMAQVCEAITYAHGAGIVHRDIKPANIVVSAGGVKVLDFGLAQITGKDSGLSTLTRTDVAMGTINYLSPEQRLSAKNVDERSDIFSLGIVFFEMLTGTLPLGSFEPPSKHRKDAGKQCNRIVSRSLNTNPDLRYQDVASLRADLLKIGSAKVTRPVALAAVALLAMVAGGVAAWPYLGSEPLDAKEKPSVEVVADQKEDAKQEVIQMQAAPEPAPQVKAPVEAPLAPVEAPLTTANNPPVKPSNDDVQAVKSPEQRPSNTKPKPKPRGAKRPKDGGKDPKAAYLERLRQLKNKKKGKRKEEIEAPPEIRPQADSVISESEKSEDSANSNTSFPTLETKPEQAEGEESDDQAAEPEEETEEAPEEDPSQVVDQYLEEEGKKGKKKRQSK